MHERRCTAVAVDPQGIPQGVGVAHVLQPDPRYTGPATSRSKVVENDAGFNGLSPSPGNTHADPARCTRWSVSTEVVVVSSATSRRLDADFGGPTSIRPSTTPTVRRTETSARARSTSTRCRPSTSPRRIPVVANTTNAAFSRCPPTDLRNCLSSATVQVVISGRSARGGDTSDATFDQRARRARRRRVHGVHVRHGLGRPARRQQLLLEPLHLQRRQQPQRSPSETLAEMPDRGCGTPPTSTPAPIPGHVPATPPGTRPPSDRTPTPRADKRARAPTPDRSTRPGPHASCETVRAHSVRVKPESNIDES